MDEKLIADSWDDIDLSDVVDNDISEPETPADQPETTEEPAAPEAEETTEPKESAETETEPPVEDLYELKHLDEVKSVTREEVIALAQKGMDYDRIRAKLDAPNQYEEFVKEMAAQQSITADEFVDNTRAALLAKKENIDLSVAKQRIQLDRREKALSQKEKAQTEAEEKQNAAERKRNEDFKAFLNTYKDVDVKSIPKEVWDSVAKGETLVNAYMRYENAQLKAQLEAEKKNNENRAKTTGSQKSPSAKKDDFDSLWYDGT